MFSGLKSTNIQRASLFGTVRSALYENKTIKFLQRYIVCFQVGEAKKMKHLKEDLELYMHHFLLRKKKSLDKRVESMVRVAENALNLNKDLPDTV